MSTKPIFCLISAIVLHLNFCFAQWKQTDGPYGPTPIFGIIEHKTLLLTITSNGYFSKNNLNDSWKFNSGISFSTFAKKGDSLFVSSGYYGFNIINLKDLNAPPVKINSMPIETLAASDSLLFRGSTNQGFFISGNNGKSWETKNNGFPIDTFRTTSGTLVYSPSSITAIGLTKKNIYCATLKGMYRTDVDFSKWISINFGLPKGSIRLIKEFNDTLYAVLAERLYQSSDSGNNWNLIFTAPSVITTVNFYKGDVYVGTGNDGIYFSSDNFISRNSLNVGLIDLCINAITNYDTSLICGTNNGIFYLKNSEWVNNQARSINSDIRTMDTSNGSIVANINDSIYISNNGETWHSIPTPIIPKHPGLTSYIGSVLTMGDTIFMSYYYDTPSFPFYHAYIKYTNNNGKNWYDLKSKYPNLGENPIRMKHEKNRLYVYENGNMLYTDNLGMNWVDLSLPYPYCKTFYDLALYNAIPYSITCGNGELLKFSSERGWIASNKDLPTDVGIIGLAYNDDALFAYLSNHKMYVSDKNGDNWVIANKGLDSVSYLNSFVHKGNLLFIATDIGIFATNDFGQNWVSTNEGLKNLQVNSITLLKDTLYAGTIGNGIWKRSLNDMKIKNPTENQIKIFPNPATDYVSVESAKINTVYTIFDMTGKEVLSGQIDSRSIIYVSNLNNGIYILVMHLGNEIKRAKLLINRQ